MEKYNYSIHRFNVRQIPMNNRRRCLVVPFRKSNICLVRRPKPVKRLNATHRSRVIRDVTTIRIQDLGLSGLSKACDPRTNCLQKFFWGCLWIAALLWCVVSLTNCVITFVSCPFTVNVKFKENKTIKAPHFTICPTDINFRNPAVSQVLLKDRYCNDAYKTAVELLKNCNMTIETLWNISRFEMTEPLYRLFETLTWLEGFTYTSRKEIRKIELITVQGVCLMFKMSIPLRCMGMQNGLEIEGHSVMPNETRTSDFYMGVTHSEEEIPFIRYTGATHRGFYAGYNQLTTVGLRVKQVIHINTWKNPCQSEIGYQKCLLECIEKKIISESNLSPCRLPYMNELLSLPLCVTEEEFLDMYTATQTAVNEFNPEMCGCIKPCNKLYYTEDYFYPIPVKHLLGIYLAIPQCDIEVIEEELSYGFTSFFSDIGGNLGLYLGMSIFSIMEILEVLVLKIRSIVRLFYN